MNRRDFVLALPAFAAAPAVRAQRPDKVCRVGFIVTTAPVAELQGAEPEHFFFRAFLHEMRRLGYRDGKNLVLDVRSAEGKYERLPGLAKALVASKPDVIVAAATASVRAAKQASGTIPIVMVGVGDPVGNGLVASLARPGANVTGHAVLTQDTGAKLLELLSASLPKLSRIAVLVNPGNQNHELALRNVRAAAQKAGVSAQAHRCTSMAQIESAYAAAARDRSDAILVPADPLFTVHARRMGELALELRLPLASTERMLVESGGLLSYGASIAGSFRRGARYVDRILKGAKPADLPVEQADRFELVLNRKTAVALGITLPQSVLLQATEVIE